LSGRSDGGFLPQRTVEEKSASGGTRRKRRDTIYTLNEKFKEEYAAGLADKWDELIDWEKRRESEGGFFEKLLLDNGASKVLDIACGTGYHAIQLAKSGLEVKATDGSEEMLEKTRMNAEKHDADIEIEKADWLHLTDVIEERYDAVVCLGNALTHLFYEDLYLRAIREVYEVLNEDGVFIVDQRNYDCILDKGYDSKHKYYYCGQEVEIEPVVVNEGMVKMQYMFSEDERYYLTMHPIRREELSGYLKETGFRRIDTYGDFEEEFDKYDPDFIIQAAYK
jgi:glycine/sarcosine N-methyltransferase